MPRYKISDLVTLKSAQDIRNAQVTHNLMRGGVFINAACLRAGQDCAIVKIDTSIPTAYRVVFVDGYQVWVDENWVIPLAFTPQPILVQKPTGNVASALIAQRKLNEEQNIKIEIQCNCTFNDLMGLGHRCGRLAPIDKGYRK